MTLRLDGQLVGPWVKLLRDACDQYASDGRVVLDLGNVSFADREGVQLLRDLAARQLKFQRVSPFIAEQMGKEARE